MHPQVELTNPNPKKEVGLCNVECSLTERRMLRFSVRGIKHLSNSTLPHKHCRQLHVGMSEVGLMSDSPPRTQVYLSCPDHD
jgi:hypothetical protein